MFDDYSQYTTILVGKRIVAAIAQKPIQRQTRSFATLCPLLWEDNGEWKQIAIDDRNMFPNRGLVWWMITNSTEEILEYNIYPGQIIVATLKETLKNGPEDDIYQVDISRDISLPSNLGMAEVIVNAIDKEHLRNNGEFIHDYPLTKPIYFRTGNEYIGPLGYEEITPVEHNRYQMILRPSGFNEDNVSIFSEKDISTQEVVSVEAKVSRNDKPPHITGADILDCRYVLLLRKPLEKLRSSCLNMENDEKFIKRINRILSTLTGNKSVREKIHEMIQNDYSGLLKPDEKQRFEQILNKVVKRIDDSDNVGASILKILMREHSIKERIELEIQKKVSEETNCRLKDVDEIVIFRKGEADQLEKEIKLLEKKVNEQKNEYEFWKELNKEEANRGKLIGEQLLKRLDEKRDEVIREYLQVDNLLRYRLHEEKQSDLTEQKNVPLYAFNHHTDNPIDSWKEFIESRLVPHLVKYGIFASYQQAGRLHLTALGCRCTLLPNAAIGAAYARAVGAHLQIENVQPDWISFSRTVNPSIIAFWEQACAQEDHLFFLLFEGVNRTPTMSWFGPWANIVADLSRKIVMKNQAYSWPNNIRIFFSLDHSETAFEPDSLLFCVAGAPFIPREEFRSNQSNKTLEGHYSLNAWNKYPEMVPTTDFSPLPVNEVDENTFDPTFYWSIRRSEERMRSIIAGETLQLSDEKLGVYDDKLPLAIRLQWPMEYARKWKKKT